MGGIAVLSRGRMLMVAMVLGAMVVAPAMRADDDLNRRIAGYQVVVQSAMNYFHGVPVSRDMFVIPFGLIYGLDGDRKDITIWYSPDGDAAAQSVSVKEFEIVAVHPKYGLAVVKLEGANMRRPPVGRMPATGDEVQVISRRGGGAWRPNGDSVEGKVSAASYELHGGDYILCDIPARAGMLGTLLCDRSGRALGIVTYTYQGGENQLVSAVPMSALELRAFSPIDKLGSLKRDYPEAGKRYTALADELLKSRLISKRDSPQGEMFYVSVGELALATDSDWRGWRTAALALYQVNQQSRPMGGYLKTAYEVSDEALVPTSDWCRHLFYETKKVDSGLPLLRALANAKESTPYETWYAVRMLATILESSSDATVQHKQAAVYFRYWTQAVHPGGEVEMGLSHFLRVGARAHVQASAVTICSLEQQAHLKRDGLVYSSDDFRVFMGQRAGDARATTKPDATPATSSTLKRVKVFTPKPLDMKDVSRIVRSAPVIPKEGLTKALPAGSERLLMAYGGAYAVVRLQDYDMVAVLNISDASVVEYIPVRPPHYQLVASGRYLYIIYPMERKIERWDLSDMSGEVAEFPLTEFLYRAHAGFEEPRYLYVIAKAQWDMHSAPTLSVIDLYQMKVATAKLPSEKSSMFSLSNRPEMSVSPDGRRVIVTMHSGLYLMELGRGLTLYSTARQMSDIGDATFTGDGEFVYSRGTAYPFAALLSAAKKGEKEVTPSSKLNGGGGQNVAFLSGDLGAIYTRDQVVLYSCRNGAVVRKVDLPGDTIYLSTLNYGFFTRVYGDKAYPSALAVSVSTNVPRTWEDAFVSQTAGVLVRLTGNSKGSSGVRIDDLGWVTRGAD